MSSRRFAGVLALAILLVIACVATWAISWQQGVHALQQQARDRVERVDANLKGTLDRYAFLPYLLSTHPYIQAALTDSGDASQAERIAQTNRFLARVNQEAGATATYVINAQGICIAASNWNDPFSFVGHSYQFRPYFDDALKGGVGRFFGIGTSHAEPGYYVARPVIARDGRTLGVAVVKLDLEWFQRTDALDPLIVSDEHGVIFLSSDPAWKYHTLEPLAPGVASDVYRSQQYAQQTLSPLPLRTESVLDRNARIVKITDADNKRRAKRYLATTRQLVEPRWQLTTFTSLDPVVSAANYAAAITAFSGVCLFLLGFYLRMRRARMRDMIRSGALLRTAYAELNHRVEERTADLSAANTRLQTEVGERTRAEQELRAAHRELVQASKLAALGQMAAGITHELNQPLAALRTFSDNTLILLERGHTAAAADNLQAIASLTDRMGRITNQLKLFIGKARPRDVSTPMPRAIVNAIRLLDSRLNGITVGIWYDPVCRLDDTPVPVNDPEIGVRLAIKEGSQTTLTLDDALGFPLDAGLSGDASNTSNTSNTSNMINTGNAGNAGNIASQLPDTPAVWCDQLRLEQLLINVVGNAADALHGAQMLPPSALPSFPPAPPSRSPTARIDLIISTTPSTVTLAILDNGPGIAEEALAHVFEPFFTTKDSNAGLGLGLAISAAIASEYGGSLRAVNRADMSLSPGEATAGAAFILTLRRVADVATQQLLDDVTSTASAR